MTQDIIIVLALVLGSGAAQLLWHRIKYRRH